MNGSDYHTVRTLIISSPNC